MVCSAHVRAVERNALVTGDNSQNAQGSVQPMRIGSDASYFGLFFFFIKKDLIIFSIVDEYQVNWNLSLPTVTY